MDHAALRVFLNVVREGSFSRASEKLLRTQPAVSLAVRRLEEELSEKLIDRSSRALLLTDAGELAEDYARRFESLEKEMLAALEELRDLSAGRLIIGANESSTVYLAQHLRAFRKSYPKIRIRVKRTPASRIPEQLLSGHLELGVVSYKPASEQIVSQVIFTDHLAFICSPQHRFARRDSVSIRELGRETFVGHNVVSPYRRHVFRKFQEHQVPLRIDLEMPSVEAMHKLIQQNEGVSFLPRMCVEEEIDQGVLCEVKVPEIAVKRQIRLVYPEKRTLSRSATAFLQLLKDLSNQPPTDEVDGEPSRLPETSP